MTRSFERMLKDAPGRKYTALQTALKAYLGLYFGPVVSFLFRSALVQFPIQVKTITKPCRPFFLGGSHRELGSAGFGDLHCPDPCGYVQHS